MLHSVIDDDEKFEEVGLGLPFPSLHVKNESDLEEPVLPDCSFYDIHANGVISESLHKHACKAYKLFDCTSLKDYGELSLKAHVFGLAGILMDYANFFRSVFGLYPLNDMSISAYGFGVAHYVSN